MTYHPAFLTLLLIVVPPVAYYGAWLYAMNTIENPPPSFRWVMAMCRGDERKEEMAGRAYLLIGVFPPMFTLSYLGYITYQFIA